MDATGGAGRTTLRRDDHIEFERKSWRAERVGWVVMTLVIVAALAGLFGNGPLSRANATSGNLHVEYERFLRHQARAEVRIAARSEGNELRVWISRGYAEGMEIHQIAPEPARVEMHADRLVYVFASDEESGPREVMFRFDVAKPWRLEGEIGVEGSEERVALRHLVYP